jgi:hypothetical protein
MSSDAAVVALVDHDVTAVLERPSLDHAVEIGDRVRLGAAGVTVGELHDD